MAASGNTIGEVNVKVTPNITGFARTAKEKIEAQLAGEEIEAKVEAKVTDLAKANAELAAVAKDRTAKIDVVTTQDRWVRDIQADLGRLLNDANAVLRPTVDDEGIRAWIKTKEKDFKELLGAFEVQIDPTITAGDRADVEAELEGLKVDLEEQLRRRPLNLVPANFETDFNKKDFAAELKSMMDQNAERVLNTNAKMDIELDYDKFQYKLRVFEAAAEAALKRIDIEINPKLNMSRMAYIRNKIKTDLGKQIKTRVDIDFDRNRVLRSLGYVTKGFKEAFGGLAGLAAKGIGGAFRGVTTAVQGTLSALASFGPLITAIIALVALILPPLVALTTGLITLAPSLLALAVPIGAVMLGLEGIGKAAEAVKPQMDELKKVMSDTFEKGFTEQFARLKAEGGFFDTLLAEMPKVATGINSLLAGVTDSVTSGKGLGNLRNIIDNVAEGLEKARGGAKGFTDGLLQLVSGISEKFPGIGQWFTQLGDKFSRWADVFTTVPQQNGLTGLQNLINNVRTGIEGLTSVFQAFWNQGMKDIQSPTFGEGMKQFFNAVRAFVTDTLPALSEGFQGIANLMDKLSPLFRLIGLGGNVVGALTSNPMTTLKELEARVDAAYKAGGNWKDALIAGLTENGMPLENVFDNTGGAVAAAAAQAGQQAGESLVSGSAQAIAEAAKNRALTPDELLKAIADETAAREAGVKAGTAVAAGAQEGANGVQSAAPSLNTPEPPKIADTLSADVKAAVAQAQQDIASIGPVLQQAVNTAILPFQQLPQLIGMIFGGLTQTIAASFGAIPSVIQAACAGIVSVVTSTFTGVLQIVNTTVGALPTVVGRAFTGMNAAATNAGTTLVQAVVTAGTGMVTEVGTWPGRLQAAFGNVTATFTTIGSQIAQGLAAGIRAGAPAAIAEAKFMAAQIEAVTRSALRTKSPSRVFMDIGENVSDGLAIGIDRRSGAVTDTVREMLQAIKDIFGDASGLTLNLNLGSGVQQQAVQATKSVEQFQSTLADTAKTATGYSDSLNTSGPTAESKARIQELGDQLLALEIQRKEVELAKSRGEIDKDTAKARLEEIKQQKLALGLEKDKLTQATKYGDQITATESKMDEFYKDIGKKVVNFPQDIAKTVGSEFMSDLGMSGDGAIPNLLEQGANYIFQVMDMDSAIAGQQVVQNRQAQQYTRR